ncbi:unnamed protein product [Rotaria sordida]|uniref:Uncharacterized protein n=1 Tax=Rotaria sordida TaxID=392033 RepID=A0A814B6K5_9BILA|nr:unnamed protein product [Rotaria sordida]
MADDEENDPTAPFNELEAFDSLWQALTWKQIRKRIPICARKTAQNRYFFANIVYLIYAIGILLVDFAPAINGGAGAPEEPGPCDNMTVDNSTKEEGGVDYTVIVNNMYIGLGVLHVVSAALYWWAWRVIFHEIDHRWNDVIMIPEYLNHIEAALYLWAATWYGTAANDSSGYYESIIHIVETVAAFVELFASFGWIMSWYRTYTRTIGRGYTFDDPDTVAYTFTTLSSFIYITYNIQILQNPEDYGLNDLYVKGDITYFVGAVFYLWANLRDDGWLWWMPVSGQYGIAAGRIQAEKPIIVGLRHLLIGGPEPIARCCRRCCENNSDRANNVVVPMNEKQSTNDNNTKDSTNRNDLSNLKCFSLTCFIPTNTYDNRLIPLLRRMTYLEKLTLYIRLVDRSTFVDGTYLHNEILMHMSQLHRFNFYISTQIPIDDSVHRLSDDNIKQTFNNIGYYQTSCIVDYYCSLNAISHVFSLPFLFNRLEMITNRFSSIIFSHVTYLQVVDTIQFNYSFCHSNY